MPIIDVDIGVQVVHGMEIPRVRIGVVAPTNADARVIRQLRDFFTLMWRDAGVMGNFRVFHVHPNPAAEQEEEEELVVAPGTPERME